ncbi:MAG: hypothetical protein AAFW59_04105 [Pseudomonadota bacterium]
MKEFVTPSGRTAIALAALGLVANAAPVSAQSAAQTQVQSRQPVRPPNPGQSLGQAQAKSIENVTCKGVQLYYTVRGTAFTCVDFQNDISIVFALVDTPTQKASSTASLLLDRATADSRAYILDPQKKGIRLGVRYREPGTPARNICALTGHPRAQVACGEVIAFYR